MGGRITSYSSAFFSWFWREWCHDRYFARLDYVAIRKQKLGYFSYFRYGLEL